MSVPTPNHDGESQGVMDGQYAADRKTKPHLRFRYRLRALAAVESLREMQPGISAPRVLEMGCAEGATLLEIRQLFEGEGIYDGVEYAESLLSLAGEMPSNVRLMQGDVTALPAAIESGHYHLATLLAVMEHLDEPERALKEAMRILQPGGGLVISCPHPMWDQIAGKVGLVKDEYHAQALGFTQLKQMLQDVGYRRIRTRPFMWAPIGILPYFHLPVNVRLASGVDRWLQRIPGSGFSFVNQLLFAQKPN